jgi:putative addiction module component (TIGR02574 family)
VLPRIPDRWYGGVVSGGGNIMPVSLGALGIDKLSVRERLDLIEQIWDSLPEQVNPEEVPAWHLAELARRRAEASPGVGKPWREVLARLGSEP